MRYFAVVITAPGNDPAVDFVSRFFAPSQGINEDPVTGSSFCTLGPYWQNKLNSAELVAKQVSQRGGDIRLTVSDDRVLIAGQTIEYLRGSIRIAH